MTTVIHDTLPPLREVLQGAINNYPEGYQFPRAFVERRAKFAVKAHLGLEKFASLPAVDYDVDYGPHGVIQIRAGRVVT